MINRGKLLVCIFVLAVQCGLVGLYMQDVSEYFILMIPSTILFMFTLPSKELFLARKKLEENKWEIISLNMTLENRQDEIVELEEKNLNLVMALADRLPIIEKRIEEIQDIQNFLGIQNEKRENDN